MLFFGSGVKVREVKYEELSGVSGRGFQTSTACCSNGDFDKRIIFGLAFSHIERKMDVLVFILSAACSVTSSCKHVLLYARHYSKLLFCGAYILVRKPDNKQMCK